MRLFNWLQVTGGEGGHSRPPIFDINRYSYTPNTRQIIDKLNELYNSLGA